MKIRAIGARGAVRHVLLPVAFSMLTGLAAAHHLGNALATDQQLVAATDQFLSALSQYEKLSQAQKASALPNLTQLALSRQQWLIAMIQLDPSVAAARMLPQSLRARVPSQAAVYVEQEVHVQGTGVFHVSDDFSHGVSKQVFKLHGPTGAQVDNVYMADPSASSRELEKAAGKKLSVAAMRVGNNLVVLDRKQFTQLQAAGGTTTTTTTTSTGTLTASSTAVQGNQTTLSILLNFTDKALSCTPSDISNRLFGSTGSSVNVDYQQSSRGLVSFSGQAVGPYTINYTSTGSCDYSGWASAANAAAQAAGINLSNYSRINYVTPPNSTCGWTGLAYMPGTQSWVQACGSTGTFAHELGHNLSFHHASTPTSEYGDSSDPMGGAQLVNHNGANRVMAGWMPAGSVQDVSAGGSYALASVSTDAAATSPQVLRMVKADTSEYYYVTLREAMNLDSTLGTGYVNTISVHRAAGALPTHTYLMQVLAAGQSFVDSTNGITITNQGVSNGIATVGVTWNGPTCSTRTPTVSMSPASQTAGPGSTLTYTVTVSNTNSSACPTSSFALAQVLPSGFSGNFGAASLSIAPGASASTALSVTSASTTLNGTYTVTAAATDSTSSLSNSAHGSDIVYADTTPPTVSITSPLASAMVSGNVSLAASATDNIGVKAVEFYVDGRLLASDSAAPYSANWNARKAGSGAHTITARAIDTSGNATSTSITVNVK